MDSLQHATLAFQAYQLAAELANTMNQVGTKFKGARQIADHCVKVQGISPDFHRIMLDSAYRVIHPAVYMVDITTGIIKSKGVQS